MESRDTWCGIGACIRHRNRETEKQRDKETKSIPCPAANDANHEEGPAAENGVDERGEVPHEVEQLHCAGACVRACVDMCMCEHTWP